MRRVIAPTVRRVIALTVRRVTALTVVLVIGSFVLPTASSAHSEFESSTPADGSTIDAAVGKIVLEFSGEVEPTGERFVILDSGGAERAPDRVMPDEALQKWTLVFDPPLAAGTVAVRWTVQAPDAHPISGSFSFAILESTPEPPVGESGDDAKTISPPTGRVEESESEILDAANETDIEHEPSDESIDDFLLQSTGVPNVEAMRATGRLIELVGTVLGIGSLGFAAAVIRRHRRDILTLLKMVRYSGVIIIIGTAIDLAANLAAVNDGWASSWLSPVVATVARSTFGLAVGLRLAAGAILTLAATATIRRMASVAPVVKERERVLVGSASELGFSEDLDAGEESQPSLSAIPSASESGSAEKSDNRLAVTPSLVVAVAVLLGSYIFDGHTATEGNRWVIGAVDIVHVAAGSVWAGGLVAFAVVLWRRQRRFERLDALELGVRFSVIAGASLVAAGIAGTVLAGIILDSVSQLWTTSWGLLLVAKFMVVLTAAGLGAYNHFVVVPWMIDEPNDEGRSRRLRTTVSCEAVLVAVILMVTTLLVGATTSA